MDGPAPELEPTSRGHELLDIGEERRLERFGVRILDRPAPGEGGLPGRDPDAWAAADARYERDANHGGWQTIDPTADGPWLVSFGGLDLELRLAASGQVGCFPEQIPIWRWVSERVAASTRTRTGEARDPVADQRRPVVLNLFAHTGAVTIAAARAGADVVHVDASRPALAWARHNARLNGLADSPIRWIADDAAGFVRRELRRERRYEGIVLDPPSFGHGRDRGAWRLADDLAALLRSTVDLLVDGSAFVVISAHTPGYGADRLGDALDGALGHRGGGRTETAELGLDARSGRRLALGAMAVWTR